MSGQNKPPLTHEKTDPDIKLTDELLSDDLLEEKKLGEFLRGALVALVIGIAVLGVLDPT